jgi:hypothetical protein
MITRNESFTTVPYLASSLTRLHRILGYCPEPWSHPLRDDRGTVSTVS